MVHESRRKKAVRQTATLANFVYILPSSTTNTNTTAYTNATTHKVNTNNNKDANETITTHNDINKQPSGKCYMPLVMEFSNTKCRLLLTPLDQVNQNKRRGI